MADSLREKIIKMTINIIINRNLELFAQLPKEERERLLDDFNEYMTTQNELLEKYKGKFYQSRVWDELPDNLWTIYRKKRQEKMKNPKPSREVFLGAAEFLKGVIKGDMDIEEKGH